VKNKENVKKIVNKKKLRKKNRKKRGQLLKRPKSFQSLYVQQDVSCQPIFMERGIFRLWNSNGLTITFKCYKNIFSIKKIIISLMPVKCRGFPITHRMKSNKIYCWKYQYSKADLRWIVVIVHPWCISRQLFWDTNFIPDFT